MTPPKHSKYSSDIEKMVRKWFGEPVLAVEEELTTLINKEKAKAELAGRRKSYQDIFHLHMAHDWNETSGDLKDWLTKELHEITRLEAQLAKDKEDGNE